MLRVFVSSVSGDFEPERAALQEEIQALGALFSGMEFFGSRADSPAEYCRVAAATPDVYVGVFGTRYGSIHRDSKLSFTHLEYQSAASANVPCLIYFKGSHGEADVGDRAQRKLKAHLRKHHVVSWFADADELRLRFLRDFVKLLHERFLDRIVPFTQAPIPAEALHALTKAALGEQIQSVAGDKYLPDLYVSRAAEQPIMDFAENDAGYRAAISAILDALAEISSRYQLAAEMHVEAARAVLARQVEPGIVRSAMLTLKEMFYADETDVLRREIDVLLNERNPFLFNGGTRSLLQRMSRLAFVPKDELGEAFRRLPELARRGALGAADQSTSEYRKLLALFPSIEREKSVHLAADLLRELQNLSDQHRKRSTVIVAPAGAGKTNLLCSLAERLSRNHPVLLLSGRSALRDGHGLHLCVQEWLDRQFRGVFSDWLNRISPSLEASGQWLFILIDGINESEDSGASSEMLAQFLPCLSERRVKVILTCRDLLWDSYAPTVRPHSAAVIRLHQFTDAQWESALSRYFRHFAIRGTISQQARETLKNPLLLRFFCQLHQGRSIGRIVEVRTLSIFEAYFEDVAQRIARRLRHVNATLVEGLLLRVAQGLWERRSAMLPLSVLRVSQEERSRIDSVYTQLVDENVIREEGTAASSGDVALRYVYDEFFEYMLARAWRSMSVAPGELVPEVVRVLEHFPAAFGAFLYYDLLSGAAGVLINDLLRALGRSPDPFAESGQTRLLYAFERMNDNALDAGLIKMLSEFERAALPEVRQRLGPILLRVAERAPADPNARAMVEKMLEIDALYRESGTGPDGGAESGGPSSWLRPRKGVELQDGTRTLPPGRFHYTDATRLSAIALLAGVIAPDDPDRISGAITALGRTDLHSALDAIISLDRTTGRVIYPLIDTYLASGIPEYQVYCTWLLRKRYGHEPASFFLRLVMASDTRVHRYAMKILETRAIEEELLTAVLGRLATPDTFKPWHARNLLRLMAQPQRFQSPDTGERRHQEILSALSKYFDNQLGSIRLEAFRAATAYRPFLDLPSFNQRIASDDDVYVRRLARTLNAQGFFSTTW